MSKFKIEIKIAARRAAPKLSISNAEPIISSVINNVMALMTKRNNPKVNTVTGRVIKTSNGFTKIFKIEMIKLAINAEPTPSIWNDLT